MTRKLMVIEYYALLLIDLNGTPVHKKKSENGLKKSSSFRHHTLRLASFVVQYISRYRDGRSKSLLMC
jgi:hypothetical protein